MVLYFSATGNTQFVARELAERLSDETINLLDRIKHDDHSPIHSDKPFVICSPVYVCEMPRFLADYLRKTPLVGCKDVYFIFTSGGYSGISGIMAGAIVRRKRMRYMGCAELTMPRNYIANDWYPELDVPDIECRIRDSAGRLDGIAAAIRDEERLKSRHVWLFEILITLPFNPVWCRVRQGVSGFQVTDKCIRCGKCARLCPLNRISIVDSRPVWTGKSCAHCMSCIQNCPVEAIEYGQITQKKKRYRFDKYRYSVPVETIAAKDDGGRGKDKEAPSMKTYYEYDKEMQVLIRVSSEGAPQILYRDEGVWRDFNSSDDGYMRAIYIGQGCWERLETITEETGKSILEEWGMSCT